MGIMFDPFSGQLTVTGSGGGGGGGSGTAARHTQIFNATTDWGSPSAGVYSLTVTSATHGKGLRPNVQVYEAVGATYELVHPNTVVINASGDVTITVLETPDTRFAGVLLII